MDAPHRKDPALYESPDTLKTIKSVTVSQGTVMNLKIDVAKPEDSFGKYLMDNVYDGNDLEAFEVFPHWHETHDEYISVLEGRIVVNLEGYPPMIVSAGDDAAFIPRHHVHSMKGFKGEKSVIREIAVPSPTWGRGKALFFNDLLFEGGIPGFWRLMRVCYDGDTYGQLPGNIKILDKAMVTVFGLIAKLWVAPKSMEL